MRFLTSFLFLFSIITALAEANLPLELIKLPEGFQIEIYAEGVNNARSLELSPNGTLFVGNRSGDKVYALVDTDNDFKADKQYIIAKNLYMPNGVAFWEGNLYVAEVHRIIRFDDIENHLDNPPKPIVINDSLPKDKWHGWKFIRIGPDKRLYVPVGAPCNVCEKDYNQYANIMRMNLDGSNLEMYVKGVRNSVGFDWHPQTREMWFTDNGRDNLGDNIPPDELNRVNEGKGQHFGFPYCFGKTISDPNYGQDHPCSEFTPAAQELGPHVASLGMRFYTGDMFPEKYTNQIFIAEHGSWNRSDKTGYQISLVRLDKNSNPISYEPFATGWLQGQNVWGRPVDIEQMPDGSLLVSDDHSGTIYRISYTTPEKRSF